MNITKKVSFKTPEPLISKYWECATCKARFRLKATLCSSTVKSRHKKPIKRQNKLYCCFECVPKREISYRDGMAKDDVGS